MSEQWGWVIESSDESFRGGSRWIALTDAHHPHLETYETIEEVRIASWEVDHDA